MKNRHLILLAAVALAVLQPQARAQAIVDLGSAAGFAVLAGSGITVNSTTITGDIGSYSTATITGSENVVTGVNHAGDSFTQAAKTALSTAYTNAAGRSATAVGAELGGTFMTPGVYTAGTLAITGTLTLDAQSNPNAVWIFQAGSTLTTASSSHVTLINGAQAANVFWQVGSSATLGSSSSFVGTMLAYTSITMTSGAMVDGRVLALGGAVTLDSNTISVPVGAIPEPATTSVLIAGVVALVIGVHRIRRHHAQG